jgi:microcystin-dependent protein
LDGPGQTSSSFTHTVIGEYLYEAPEKSELLIYKGNDTGAGASGPDRVRVLASGGFKVDTGFVASWPEGGAPPSTITYENALFVSGTNGNVGINTSTPQYKLDVNGDLRVVGSIIGHAASVFTAGMIMIWATSTAPTGWFVCDGTAVSRTTYSVLFALISSTYGNGDGVNTFNLPDMRSRFPLGTSGTYGLGTTGGSMTQTLTSNQIPAHSHGITDPGHKHGMNPDVGTTGYSLATSGIAEQWVAGNGINTHLSTTSVVTDITINNAGGGQAFNIINAYQAVNYIIKY